MTHIIGIISIVIGLYYGIPSATEDKQDRIIEMSEKLLLKDMKAIEKKREKEFISKYSLGYQLLAFDASGVVIPYESRIRFDFTVNWNDTRLEENENQYIINLPRIETFRENVLVNTVIVVPKETVGKVDVLYLDFASIDIEIVDYKYYGWICLLGFDQVD
jgi:hypothetical protein